jgi:hypothetical protein
MGQIRRGGKGLMAHDKRRLAEAAGVSVPRLEKMLARIGKRSAKAGDKTYPVSRLLNTKYSLIAIPRRVVGTRGFAGRASRGGKGMTGREKEILALLMKEKKRGNVRRVLGIGGTTGALGAGTAIGSD